MKRDLDEVTVFLYGLFEISEDIIESIIRISKLKVNDSGGYLGFCTLIEELEKLGDLV